MACRVCHLAGLIGSTITGVVLHLVLADLPDLKGAAATADLLLTAGSARLPFPLGWVASALVRGELVHSYASPFIDVRVLGHPRVFGNVGLVRLLLSALAAEAVLLARR